MTMVQDHAARLLFDHVAGSAGVVTFHSAAAETPPTASGATGATPAGSVAGETMVLDGGVPGFTTFVFGAGGDSVSVGGLAGILPLPGIAAGEAEPRSGFRIDIDTLNLAGADFDGGGQRRGRAPVRRRPHRHARRCEYRAEHSPPNAAMNALVEAKRHADSLPLDAIDVSDPQLFLDDVWQPYFARLRHEDPVHRTASPVYGDFWSVTKYRDIMQVETSQQIYSSDMTLGGITLVDQPAEFRLPNFIAMDSPKHDAQRKVVSPIVAPGNLQNMAGIIRERAARILDELPRGETFDWVDRVSVELTTQMLATLFDFPFEERRQLTHWSNVAICNINAPDAVVRSEPERLAEMRRMAEAMIVLWKERASSPPRYDLISMLAQGESTRDLPSRPHELMGTLLLLIVGGNDTTRNSISGGVWALSQHPGEYRKLRENPRLVSSLVPEIIRWQTPVLYMRRTAMQDAELGGKRIREGDKLAMWYVSGNRDEDAIERADEFMIDRARPRQHLSFGFGIHRCVGNRLAELQLTILWEEILQRGLTIEVMAAPKRIYSSFIHGISELPVRVT